MQQFENQIFSTFKNSRIAWTRDNSPKNKQLKELECTQGKKIKEFLWSSKYAKRCQDYKSCNKQLKRE